MTDLLPSGLQAAEHIGILGTFLWLVLTRVERKLGQLHDHVGKLAVTIATLDMRLAEMRTRLEALTARIE